MSLKFDLECPFTPIVLKGKAFFQAASHMHLRAAADILQETKPFVLIAIARGFTWDQFKDFLMTVHQFPEEVFLKDSFLLAVKRMFEKNTGH